MWVEGDMRNRWQEMTGAKSFVGVYSRPGRSLVPVYVGSRFSYEMWLSGRCCLLLQSKSKNIEKKRGNVNFNAIEG
jgi:putative hemolysin